MGSRNFCWCSSWPINTLRAHLTSGKMSWTPDYSHQPHSMKLLRCGGCVHHLGGLLPSIFVIVNLNCNRGNVNFFNSILYSVTNHCIIIARCFVSIFKTLSVPCQIVMTVKLHSSVPADKCTIKCSSMKSGVFLIAHHPLKEGVLSRCSTFNQIVAQCMNRNPWITVVTPWMEKPECSSC